MIDTYLYIVLGLYKYLAPSDFKEEKLKLRVVKSLPPS